MVKILLFRRRPPPFDPAAARRLRIKDSLWSLVMVGAVALVVYKAVTQEPDPPCVGQMVETRSVWRGEVESDYACEPY